MSIFDQTYHALLERVLREGEERTDRTGTGTLSLFGPQMEFDLNAHGLPVLTTKRVHFHSVVTELLWMLRGETNVAYLQAHGVRIWDEWADAKGDLGPVYGKQWRSWEWFDNHHGWQTIDQIKALISALKDRPDSRRHIVSAWNPAEVEDMALPPCHCLFQFYVRAGRFLDCKLYQRSGDLFLGVPFNMASYALLTFLLAREVGLQAGRFIHTFGDVHVYRNHLDAARTQLDRDPALLAAPLLSIDSSASLFNLGPEEITLLGYQSFPKIEAKVSI